MSNILNKILATKTSEITEAKNFLSVDQLKKKILELDKPRDFIQALRKKHAKTEAGVIAEIKKASPSKGIIRENFDPEIIAQSYESGGAACLSVLTDRDYFQGHPDFIKKVKSSSKLPVLRKDFIIDPYQIYESRVLGADCILLIVAALDLKEMKELESIANDLGMAVLVESHNQQELDAALELSTPLIGINNRDLKTFDVSLKTSIDLVKSIKGRIPITESGIFNHEDIKLMNENHINTFLIGEAFMRKNDPGEALKELFFN
jgi:indole-3-glycerol phosphate synthase|tara:strand:- start:598 stop:1386 length:789 start_codon:yes stop_codon:yes gene_type:complete